MHEICGRSCVMTCFRTIKHCDKTAPKQFWPFYRSVFTRESIYAIARISHGNSVRPSVCPSHGWISQKRLKLGSRSFHHTVATSL